MFVNPKDAGIVKGVHFANDENWEKEKSAIYSFLQGAVYCWCNNNPNKWFSMRDFMGGNNSDWKGTPLEALYNKHKDSGKTIDQAIEAAGKDSGWLLKNVIDRDKRHFETKTEEVIRKYKWVGDEK